MVKCWETFGRLFLEILANLTIALKFELHFYLNCAYSWRSTGCHSILWLPNLAIIIYLADWFLDIHLDLAG